MNGKKIGLVIGTNNYAAPGIKKLDFAESDAKSIKDILSDTNICEFDEVEEIIDQSYIEATKKIKAKFPETKVIILSMYKESGLIKSIVDIGADGYLIKNSDKNELMEAITRVASGQQYFSSDVTMSLLKKASHKTSQFKPDYRVSELTEREIEILILIAEGLSNKEIGEKLFISHRTVDSHRTNLMKKVGVNNIAGLIRFAIKTGFVS